MKVDILFEQVGLLENFSFKLRPFTILAGLNGTGKSTITRSLYSILNVLNKEVLVVFLSNVERQLYRYSFVFPDDSNKYQQTINDIKFLKDLFSDTHYISLKTDKINAGLKFKAIKERLSIIQIEISQQRFIRHSNLSQMLQNIIELLDDIDSVELQIIEEQLRESFCKNFQIPDTKQFINNKKSYLEARISFSKNSSVVCDIVLKDNNKIAYDIKGEFISECKKLNNVLYIESPVHFKLAKFLIERRETLSLNELTGVPEYVYDMLDLLSRKIIKSHNPILLPHEIGDFLEALNGKLKISNNLEMTYQDNSGMSYNLEQTAMGIINLGIINLLIENGVIEKNGFIILDEPETNLHPEWQVILVDLLYLLSKKGVNIIIATHSSNIVRRLENILMKEEDKDFFGINYLSSELKDEYHTNDILKEMNNAYIRNVFER